MKKTKHIKSILLLLSITFFAFSQSEYWYASHIYKNEKAILAFIDTCETADNYSDLKDFITGIGNVADETVANKIKSQYHEVIDAVVNKNVNNIINYVHTTKIDESQKKQIIDFVIKTELSGGTTQLSYGKTGDLLEFGSNILSDFSIPQSEIIVGFTDLMIDRAKEELAIAYFDQWVKTLEDTELTLEFNSSKKKTITNKVKLYKLIPHSFNIIKHSRTKLDANIGNHLVTAFRKDIKELNSNIITHAIPEECQEENWYSLYCGANSLYLDLSKETPFPMAIDRLYKDSTHSSADTVLNVLSIVSSSFTTPDGSNWMKLDESLSPKTLQYYSRLLKANRRFPDSLKSVELDKMLTLTSNVIGKIVEVYNATANNSNADNSGKEQVKQVIDVVSATLPLIDEFAKITYKSTSAQYKSLKSGIEKTEHLIGFYKAIENKSFSDASLSMIAFLNAFTQDGEEEPKKLSNLINYITLASNICQADSASQVKEILDKAILPVESYRIKRSVKHSISLNAYPGYSAGGELLLGKDIERKESKSPFHSLFLPVGMNISWSKATTREPKTSHSMFLSIFDFGVMANYRITNTHVPVETTEEDNSERAEEESVTVEKLPDVKFKHFISPGLFYVCGLKKSPISLGVGVQMTPKLRDITSSGALNISDATSLRGTLFAAVDIPIAHLTMRGPKKDTSKRQENELEKQKKKLNEMDKKLKELEEKISKAEKQK